VTGVTTVNDYALHLNDEEEDRYRFMATIAAEDEATAWRSAGVVPGAAVVDVGCGPGAMLAVLAEAVGPSGRAIGVDIDPEAVRRAAAAVAFHPRSSAVIGAADDTGLEGGTFDVAMCRHVLAHNGGREQRIVDHLARLIRPGGALYLVDIDMAETRMIPTDPELDIFDRYRSFHAQRGNDLQVGLHLPALMRAAGLDVELHYPAMGGASLPAGLRGPAWAARDAMVAEGVADDDDLARWEAAFTRMDAAPRRPWMAVGIYVAVGRRPR
jgi:SAM-dependent methyltransferase